jgi:hypothetical protein
MHGFSTALQANARIVPSNWGCPSKSSIAIMQQSQSKILRMMINAPWYVTN